MSLFPGDQLLQVETTCGSLLYELQVIWDEVGESDAERDKMILEIEQECLEVYKKKVDQANHCRAQLRQAIADSEAELVTICSALEEHPLHARQLNQNSGSLKEELKAITPQLEEMRKRKVERENQILDVKDQIQKISFELGATECTVSNFTLDNSDLSVRRLDDLQRQLESLQKEKSDQLQKVMQYLNKLNSLCAVLGIDFKETIREIHPSLSETEGSKCINKATTEPLASAIHRLRELKIERMQKLQDLATSMLELWNLMDTPSEEQQQFRNVTCNIAASEEEITEANALSIDFIKYVEAEVSRLEQQKVSKMKELVLKKKTELEEIRRRIHLLVENVNDDTESTIDAIEAGAIDASLVLGQIEIQISTVKEEAFCRKDILEKVEKWLAACDEEAWLEEYNRDENRFGAGRGAHLALKRAEKARALVNKIPSIVENLAAKVIQWENERDIEFTYDGVRLLSMLENYMVIRQEKEEEHKRQRDQKRLQGQLIAEQEALYGSKPSPLKPQSAKKVPKTSTGGPNRRLSLGGLVIQPPKTNFLQGVKSARSAKKTNELRTLSPGRKDTCITGHPMKKLSYNATTPTREAYTPRKPFAPLLPVSNIPLTPPKKTIVNVVEEEIENNKPASMPIPKTPMAVSAPMEMAETPATISLVSKAAVKVAPAQDLEYSFEERRLEFYVRRNYMPSLVQM